MKVFFVGIHNQPGKKPLDESTPTGDIITKIAMRIPFRYEVVRTNLYDLDFMPEHWGPTDCPEWARRVGFDRDKDLIVALGEDVKVRMFHYFKDIPKVSLMHPGALRWRRQSEKKYVRDAVDAIRKFLIP